MSIPYDTFNPYLHGVLLHNYLEDTFYTDLQKDYIKKSKCQLTSDQIPISEFTDKYLWPRFTKAQLYNPVIELTMIYKSNLI